MSSFKLQTATHIYNILCVKPTKSVKHSEGTAKCKIYLQY